VLSQTVFFEPERPTLELSGDSGLSLTTHHSSSTQDVCSLFFELNAAPRRKEPNEYFNREIQRKISGQFFCFKTHNRARALSVFTISP
jgi:hypothetical protein